ncbi:MAG: hypothetical protein CMJ84_03080 [Planctomycetes bacterium]|jgi:hypothetical protein|nr:hypothetical protein [Planctomycetota bacterium]MDP6410101.1 PEP-CTERM sorting domain-containing protein [Planctomycetota bacterium]
MKALPAILAGLAFAICTSTPTLGGPLQQTKYSASRSGTKVPTHSPEPLTVAALAGGAALGLAARRRKQKQG